MLHKTETPVNTVSLYGHNVVTGGYTVCLCVILAYCLLSHYAHGITRAHVSFVAIHLVYGSACTLGENREGKAALFVQSLVWL